MSPLGAHFTKMAANGNEKAFCVITFLDYRVDVCIITKGAHIEHLYGVSQKLGMFFC
jgi:hypothetical protein